MILPSIEFLLMALAIGAVLGFLGGMFGIGGGIIAVPLFVLLFGMDQAHAQGTALVLMVPNLLLGWWRYQQKQPVPLGGALTIGLVAMITTGLIARFAVQLDPDLLGLLFGLFLGGLAVNMLRGARLSDQLSTNQPPALLALGLVGFAGGACMGLLGIGGGLLATPLLVNYLRQKQAVAQGYAMALAAPSALVALTTYAQAGRVDWPLGIGMAIGGLLVVSAGVAIAQRLPERRMRRVFCLLLCVVALWLSLSAVAKMLLA